MVVKKLETIGDVEKLKRKDIIGIAKKVRGNLDVTGRAVVLENNADDQRLTLGYHDTHTQIGIMHPLSYEELEVSEGLLFIHSCRILRNIDDGEANKLLNQAYSTT